MPVCGFQYEAPYLMQCKWQFILWLTTHRGVLAPAQDMRCTYQTPKFFTWCADTRRRRGLWAGGALACVWAAEEGPAAGPEVRTVGASPFLSTDLRGVSAQILRVQLYKCMCGLAHMRVVCAAICRSSAWEQLHLLLCSMYDNHTCMHSGAAQAYTLEQLSMPMVDRRRHRRGGCTCWTRLRWRPARRCAPCCPEYVLSAPPELRSLFTCLRGRPA